MCGVVGYVGSKDAVAVLLDGLRRLEYRGYDSAGVAVLNGRGVETRKLAGRIAALRDLVAREPVHGTCGIGHTRDRKSTRLNSSHSQISYAVFCLKKKNRNWVFIGLTFTENLAFTPPKP